MNRVLRKSHASPKLLALLLLIGLGAPVLFAEHTRYWEQSSYTDFEKGTAKGVALRSDGKLLLAPQFTPLADPNVAYLWALRTDSKGNLYAAGGSSAKVLRYDAAGKVTTVFQSSELAAQALAVDAQDNLYVATSPDGKIYKVTPAGQKSVFFEPKTKYIWDVVIGPSGTIYVATGDTGQIFAVNAEGKGEVFYKSDQAHIRTLAFDHKGDLIAGTEPDGLILRIPKTGQAGETRRAFVLYETPNKEITSLVVDRTDNIYAASIGEKSRSGSAPFAMPVPEPPRQQQQPQSAGAGGGTVTLTFESSPTEQQQASPFTPLPSVSGSSVYKIAPDGSPQELWTSRDTLVYSLGLDGSGRLLLGTGNKGVILSLDGDHLFSSVEKTETQQVTGLAQRPGGKIYVCTANPGKVFSLGPDASAEGTFESQPFDARSFSRWGRLEWWAEDSGVRAAGSSRAEFYARAGNTSEPDENWSAWAGPYMSSGQQVDLPPARYAQWKVVLHDSGGSPLLSWVHLSYLPKNLPPQIEDVVLQDPNVRVQGIQGIVIGDRQGAAPRLRMPQAPGSQSSSLGFGGSAQPEHAAHFDAPPQASTQKGYESALWLAQDDNDDDLVYSVYYRGEGEKQWKLLKNNLHDPFYSWDTASMADGGYYLKIVASDAPSNPPAEALETARESERFEVDNTPPAASGLEARPSAGSTRIRFRAKDSGSAVARAEFSVDAGDWKIVEPEGRLSDSPEESYDFVVQDLTPGEHTVAVRVFDRFENNTAAKVTVQIPAAAH